MGSIVEYIERLLQGANLTREQARQVLDAIFEGSVPEAQVAAFLTAMRIKGATAQELAGLAGSLRSHAVVVKTDIENLIDTCGTGGATVKTFNVSTAAAIVAAGVGAYVAKHGNRGITSKCGSADVLKELGVNVEAGPETVAQCIRQAHVGFMFAPKFHPAMRFVQPIRKSLEFRTVFNILGPLANPAGVTAQVMGVAEPALLDCVCEALRLLGVRRAMVVHSQGMDEISTVDKTSVCELVDGKVRSLEFDASEYGIRRADVDELRGGDAATNAAIIRNVLSGKEKGAKRDIVVLNAAAAIVVAGLAADLAGGLAKAEESIDSGAAMESLETLIEVSNQAT
jgi:anthranilate phosphoribosyltransferase